jgi:hypothetical protein
MGQSLVAARVGGVMTTWLPAPKCLEANISVVPESGHSADLRGLRSASEPTHLRGQIEAMQAQLAAEESATDQARQRAEEAVQVANALQRAEEARQGRGLHVRRLRAAWRGSV